MDLILLNVETEATIGLELKRLSEENSNLIEIQDNYLSRFSYVLNIKTKFYFSTNEGAPNFRLISIDIDNPDELITIIPENENVLRVSAGGNYFFCHWFSPS